MQKLIRRTAQAEKQAARRARLREASYEKAERVRGGRLGAVVSEEIRLQLNQARRARWETWLMGPLAPQRNHAGAVIDPTRRGNMRTAARFGEEVFANENVPHWGAVSAKRIRNENNPMTLRGVEARCAWAGTPKRLCLAEGDRVVVVEGPFKGSVGAIKEIQLKYGTLTIDGVAITNVTMPEALVTDPKQAVQQVESALPIDAVRLVHPLTDPATGRTRDVIVRQLRAIDFQLDRATRRLAFSRIVPGLNVRIPWPRPAVPPPPPEDELADTLRIDAEQVTFVPTLLRPPAPAEVLDELRNKFSRFRTRHTAAYVARLEAEAAAAKEAKKYGPALVKGTKPGLPPAAMRTPLDEFHIQQKALRRARGQPQLDDPMLEKIGRYMAQTLAERSPSSPSSSSPSKPSSSSS